MGTAADVLLDPPRGVIDRLSQFPHGEVAKPVGDLSPLRDHECLPVGLSLSSVIDSSGQQPSARFLSLARHLEQGADNKIRDSDKHSRLEETLEYCDRCEINFVHILKPNTRVLYFL